MQPPKRADCGCLLGWLGRTCPRSPWRVDMFDMFFAKVRGDARSHQTPLPSNHDGLDRTL